MFDEEIVSYEEWIGVTAAVSDSGKSDTQRVKNILKKEFSTGIYRDINDICMVEDIESYEMNGRCRLDVKFAEVSLRALERNLDLDSRSDYKFAHRVAQDFEDFIDAEKINDAEDILTDGSS